MQGKLGNVLIILADHPECACVNISGISKLLDTITILKYALHIVYSQKI